MDFHEASQSDNSRILQNTSWSLRPDVISYCFHIRAKHLTWHDHLQLPHFQLLHLTRDLLRVGPNQNIPNP